MVGATPRPVGRCQRLYLTTACLLTALLFMPWLAAAQADPDLGAVAMYHSPEFGYLFWWDTSEWTIDDQATEPGSDWMQLSSSEATVSIWGFAASGVTAESCLLASLDPLRDDPQLVRFEFINELRGAPAITVSPDGRAAATELILGFESATGRQTIAARHTCSTVVPNDFLLYTSEWTTAETYSANSSPFNHFAADSLLSSLTLPRWVWPAEPDATWTGTLPVQLPQPIVAPDRQEVAILTAHLPDCARHRGSYPWVIVIENTGFTSFEIGPDDFFSVYDGVARGPDFAQWLSPPVESARLAVQPGDTALLHLQLDWNDEPLNYLDPWGNLIQIGHLLGCQGGAAAPVVIDME